MILVRGAATEAARSRWGRPPIGTAKIGKRTSRALSCVWAMGLVVATAVPSIAKVKVVASVTDLGSIAAAVGGSHVEVKAINRADRDPHRVEVLPSYMVRVARADLYLKVGMYLDTWADQIIEGSHNGRLQVVDCSLGIDPVDKPIGRVDASMGDVHPAGNPHYWLDPRNGAIVARTIAEALARNDPDRASEYRAAAEAFADSCHAVYRRGLEAVRGLPTKEILTYHASWAYLLDALGLTLAGTVEPVPGIPPTARHLAELVDLIRKKNIALLLVEPYFSDEAGDFLRRETGIAVFKVSPSCDDTTPGSYLAHFDEIYGVFRQVRSSR